MSEKCFACHDSGEPCYMCAPKNPVFTWEMLDNVRLERESGLDENDNHVLRAVAVLDREQWFEIARQIMGTLPPRNT
jgi:hypothetical protein